MPYQSHTKTGDLPTGNHQMKGKTAFCVTLPHIILCLSLLMASSAIAASPNANASTSTSSDAQKEDVRVLIDISGSMKRTDPNNLRTPALKLFVSLLPNGSNAGVWTFGQWVNMLVKSGEVNSVWKTKARDAAKEISSLGLHTNIEDAIRRSTWDWKKPEPKTKRSLILLTDGLVDVSKDTKKNYASRQRILDELLPQLQQANITIHAIALSQEADHELLRQLSAATHGWFETVETADGLERLFLRMFEKVSSTDKLPLIDNQVTIDKSIHEATFLVFRKAGADETSLISPSGKIYDLNNQPDSIQWYREDRYDLITINKPEEGEWKINAALDPDNRVMIVTDLKLQTTTLPNSLEAFRSRTINVQLEQDGEIITSNDFLRFIKMSLNQQSMSGQHWESKIKDDGRLDDKKAQDGIYTITLDQSLQPGEHELEILVDGKTFKRTARQLVKVYDNPADISLTPNTNNSYTLSIIPYQDIINPDTLLASALYTQPSGETTELVIPRTGANEWTTEIITKDTGKHQLIVNLNGKRHDDSLLEKASEPIVFTISEQAEQEERITPQDPVIEPVKDISPGPKPEPAGDQTTTKEKPPARSIPTKEENSHNEPEVDWLMVSLRILVFNIIFGILIFGGYKLWPIVRKKILPNPVEALSND